MDARMRNCSGQSTLEYALVLLSLLVSIAALGLLLTFLQRPATFDAVVGSSAHVLSESDPLATVQDAAVF